VFQLQKHNIRVKQRYGIGQQRHCNADWTNSGTVSGSRDTVMLTGQTASKPDKGVNWIDLADRDKWRAIVNMVMNLPFR
jgi:hypothetical protein